MRGRDRADISVCSYEQARARARVLTRGERAIIANSVRATVSHYSGVLELIVVCHAEL